MNQDPAAASPSLDSADRLLDLVGDALELPPGERAAFLVVACGGDAALLAEARSLVEHGEQAGGEFLGRPAHDLLQGEDLGGLEAGSLPPGEMLGECRIISLLGEGGMGEVYLAEDTKLERRVAVKLLKRRLDDASLARRFRHERKVLAALTHPNIARLYGGGVTPEGRSYLIMEYVDGERLDKFCTARKLGVTERLALFLKVCAAVTYAHQNLVVHRDLKPANIRVTPESEPKLLDFGIAKLLDPEGDAAGARLDPTATLQGAMTPEYASPEQLRGETITTVSDVYSLGVVLYELLCGQRPFAHLKSRRPDELVRAVCEEEAPRPSTVVGRTTPTTVTTTVPAGQVPATRERPATLRRLLEGDLDNIVAKSLRSEPARRYPSALALSEDLRRHAEGLPVTACKDTLGYRVGKFVRRNTVGVSAAALILFSLTFGLLAAMWQARAARLERDRTRIALKSAQIARSQAESSREQTERLNDFLQKLLTSPSPQEMGKDVKVVEVLDVASKNVDHNLAGEPEVLAQVHRSLGTAYINLGMLDPGETQMRAALNLFQRVHGDDDAASVSTKYRLAYVLLARKRPLEAEPLLHAVLRWQQQESPPNPDARVRTLDCLSNVYILTNHLSEAESTVEQMRVLSTKAHGEESVEYMRVVNTLASVKRARADYIGSAEAARKAVDICDKIGKSAKIDVLAPELNLCMMLFALDRRKELSPALTRAERDVRAIVGESSHYYGGIISIQTMDAFRTGEYQEAISSARRALDILAPVYAPNDAFVVTCRGVLGLALTRTGHATEGEPFLRTAIADGKNGDEAYFPVTVGNLETALGECLLAQKRYIEAEPLLLTGHDDLEKRLGPQNRLTIQAMQRLHDLYIAWHKPEQAARYPTESNATPPAAQPAVAP